MEICKMGRTFNMAKRVEEGFTKQIIFDLKLEGRIGVFQVDKQSKDILCRGKGIQGH